MLEPTGAWRDDYRMAYLCAIIANIVRSKKDGTVSPSAFMEDFTSPWDKDEGDEEDEEVTEERPRQTVEEQKRILQTLAKIYGGD